jgi:hypothetical protein
MGLLRAARGGVIEDLAVEWGSGNNEKEATETDDDFEVVANPQAAQAPLPPLNLFGEQSTDDATELGPNKAIVNLPPPPVIQQAPKSDKLPIPLYPGFRCSIFAIIKQGANPGPHSPHIKITGNVLGRDVTLQVPVNPVSITNNITQGSEVNKLLHTLAAKALIQVFEDMSSTPETKAQIERLGKRYSLASSVTSFLAIDEENHTEREAAVEKEVVEEAKLADARMPPPRPFLMAFGQARPASSARPAPSLPMAPGGAPDFGRLSSFADSRVPQPAPMASYSMPSNSAPKPSAPVKSFGGGPVGGLTGGRGGGGMDRYSSRGGRPPPSRQSSTSLVSQMKASISSVLERGEKLDSLAQKSDQLSASASSFRKKSKMATEDRSRRTKASVPLADDDSMDDEGWEPTKPASAVPLSVEALARAQEFDGSFRSSPQHVQMVASGGNPPVPQALAGLSGDEGTKRAVWATLLTIACMEKRLAGEKDVWEFLADKARDYILATLQNLCQDSGQAESLMKELTTAANSAI